MKESEILEKAADGLERYGWTTYQEVSSSDSSMCAIGAIKYAMGTYVQSPYKKIDKLVPAKGNRWNRERANTMLRTAQRVACILDLVEADSENPHAPAIAASHLVSWNDTEAETADQVITAFRHAAKFAKEEEDAAA